MILSNIKSLNIVLLFICYQGMSPYIIFSLSLLLIVLKDQIIQAVGVNIYSSVGIAFMIIILTISYILSNANKKATNNMDKLFDTKKYLIQTKPPFT